MALTINHQTNDISATSGSVTIDGSAVGGGGSWSLISTTTVSSSISSVDFTSLSGETYYKVVAKGVRGSTNANLTLRVSRNSIVQTSASYSYVYQEFTPSSTTINTYSASGATAFIVGFTPAATTGGNQSEFFVYDTNANRSTIYSRSVYHDGNANRKAFIFHGGDYADTSNALDGLSILAASGTIEAGTFSLYSLVTSQG